MINFRIAFLYARNTRGGNKSTGVAVPRLICREEERWYTYPTYIYIFIKNIYKSAVQTAAVLS